MEPNATFTGILVEMGFPEQRAQKALLKTHNASVEAALTWLTDHEFDPDIDAPITEPGVGGSSSYALGLASTSDGDPVVGVPSFGMPSGLPVVVHPDGEESSAMVIGVSGDCKVALVVPREAELTERLLASKCAQAAVGMYRVMMVNQVPWMSAWEYALLSEMGTLCIEHMCREESQGERMDVLEVQSREELKELAVRALDKTLLVHTVEERCEQGVEEDVPMTILALGGLAETVDQIVGHLNEY